MGIHQRVGMLQAETLDYLLDELKEVGHSGDCGDVNNGGKNRVKGLCRLGTARRAAQQS